MYKRTGVISKFLHFYASLTCWSMILYFYWMKLFRYGKIKRWLKESPNFSTPRFSNSPLLFFLVGFAILKDFSYLFAAKFSGRKFYGWRHDNWRIGQWVIFHAAPDTAYVNHFFPREFIIWFKSIQAKQVDLETSSLAWSLHVLMHWSSLRSLLRTYERSIDL